MIQHLLALGKGVRQLAVPVLLGAASASAQAPVDLRVALVIGNSAYTRAPLQNPANDAEAMARSLKSLGFDVIELRDGSKAQMAEAIAKVRETLKGKQGVGMLYYSGHGLQLDWRNYMVPVDASLSKPADVPEQTVDVGTVIDAFKTAGNRMNILVLDACRDNPFSGTASGKGLAQLDAPPGTFLAYSTAPGNVADDGDGTNGLYTQFLLAELRKPTARIEDVFKRVRFQVRQKSAGRQIPWESTSLEDDFYFDDANSRVAKAERDRLVHSASERERVFAQEKAHWDRIKDSKSAGDFYAFVNQYPSGTISELASARIEALQKAQTTSQVDKHGLVQVPASDRFRLGDSIKVAVRDDLTKITSAPWISRVTAITENAVHIDSDVVYTREGASVRNSFSPSFDPPRPEIPSGDYVVGKRWTFRTIQTNRDGSKGWVEGDAHIAAVEEITVPAGTFKTYRVELNSITQWGDRVKIIRWMQPDWGFFVRLTSQRRPPTGPPSFMTWEIISRTRSG